MGVLFKVKCGYCGFKSTPIRNDHCRRCNKQIPELLRAKKPVTKEIFSARSKESTLTKLLRRRQEALRKEKQLEHGEVETEGYVMGVPRGRILGVQTPPEKMKSSVAGPSPTPMATPTEDPYEPLFFKSPIPNKFSPVVLLNSKVTRTATAKEPPPREPKRSEELRCLWKNRDQDLEDLISGTMTGFFTLVPCRSVRIGSYKVIPEERVILSSVGIWICLPTIWDAEKKLTLTIDIFEIEKVLVFYSKPAVLFIYVAPSAVIRIRKLLDMDPSEGPYFDPQSSDETKKRIALLFMPLHIDMIKGIQDIFGRLGLLGELTPDESNDLLVRSSPLYPPFHSNMINVFEKVQSRS